MTDQPSANAHSALRLGFVGAGRVASALAPALSAAGYEVVAVASRRLSSAETLAGGIEGCQARASAQDVADAADLVFLTVPDDVISSEAGKVRWRSGVAVVHCSGATGAELLAQAALVGALTGSLHPLQTFSGGQTPLAGVTIAIEGSSELLATLEEMALALGCRPVRLQSVTKPLYHASAVMASNYVVTLLGQAARLWASLGRSEAEALEALLPLVKTTVTNVERNGPRAALTGPIARGDAGTVLRHLGALRGEALDLIPLYAELGRKTLPLASLAPSQQAEMESILQAEEKKPCA